MARSVEIYRDFNFSTIHICLEDLSDVTDENLKIIYLSGEYMQWNVEASDKQKQKFFDRLLAKIYRQLAETHE